MIKKYSCTLKGHRTSLSLEEVFWEELVHIAQARGQSITHLLEDIDNRRQGNLSSAIRVFILEWVKAR